MDEAGEYPPDITAQAELAWGHILKMLEPRACRCTTWSRSPNI